MKKIGEILIEQGTISQTQLEEALQRQKKEPNRLIGEILIQMGYVSEENIVVALATQFNVPYLPIANFTMDQVVAQLIPKELIQKYLCIPLERIGDLLTVVMADPTSEQAIKEIGAATNCKIQVFVATATEIAAAIQQYYGLQVASTIKPEEKVSKISFRSARDQRTQERK